MTSCVLLMITKGKSSICWEGKTSRPWILKKLSFVLMGNRCFQNFEILFELNIKIKDWLSEGNPTPSEGLLFRRKVTLSFATA